MGNTCNGQTNPVREVISLNELILTEPELKSQALSIRMGQVQKLRSPKLLHPNRFIFIIPIKSSQQLIKVQCSIVSHYSDNLSLKIPLLNGGNMVNLDVRNAPIIDIHDIQTDRQIFHKFIIKNSTNTEQKYTVKVYPFNNFHDAIFKNGLYEIYLYNKIDAFKPNHSKLRDYFIIDKGQTKSLVFIYSNFLYSLQDVLRFRKEAHAPYTFQEQVFIINQILHNYRILFQNSIVHRDIRPAKIFLADCSQSTHNPLIKNNGSLGYQLLNLESCRKISSLQYKQGGPNQKQQDLLLTVRGVPINSSSQVFDIAQRKEQIGNYNPLLNDRTQLSNTIMAICTLHLTSQLNIQNTNKIEKPILDLINGLKNLNEQYSNICNTFQNETKKYNQQGILDSDYNICLNNLPKLIKKINQQRIQQSTTQVLFSLHHRELFTYKLDKLMDQNYKNHKPYNNISILDRIGRHYQSIGVSSNDYFKEELNLLLLMAEQQRLRGLNTEHIINQSNQLYSNKLNGRLRSTSQGIILKAENAYLALSKNDLQTANKVINQAFVEAGASTQLTKQNQIKLILAKGIIETATHGPDAGDVYFSQGLELSNNREGFITQVQMLQYRSTFQYLLGKNSIMRLSANRGIMRSQQVSLQCAKCQATLIMAKQIKIDIPMRNPLPLANIYESLGDLKLFKQDYQGAVENYERAYRLYQGSQVQISQSQKYRLLNKIYNHYTRYSQNSVEQHRLQIELNKLQMKNRDRQIQRDDRQHFKKIRWLKQQKRKNIGEKNNIIQEVEERQEDQSKYVERLVNEII